MLFQIQPRINKIRSFLEHLYDTACDLLPTPSAKGHPKCACLSPWPSVTGYLASPSPVNLTWIQTLFIHCQFVWAIFKYYNID